MLRYTKECLGHTIYTYHVGRLYEVVEFSGGISIVVILKDTVSGENMSICSGGFIEEYFELVDMEEEEVI
jgi:hypothetical protein